MSDINAPIQIPSELNVPETTSDNDTIEPILPKSTTQSSAPQSADEMRYPKHRLQLDAKSQSMFNFSAAAAAGEPTVDEADAGPESEPKPKQENETIVEGPPMITLSPPSSTFRRSAGGKSTGSLNNFEMRPLSTNEMKLSANRNRANSIAGHNQRDDDEFDELKVNGNVGSQLRIRSSIISMFGRMGQMRRPSTFSQSSANGTNAAENNDHAPPLRSLPQIAATKILRAFSYVGKAHGNPHKTILKHLEIT